MKVQEIVRKKDWVDLAWEVRWPATDENERPVDALIQMRASAKDCINLQRRVWMRTGKPESPTEVQLLEEFMDIHCPYMVD